MLLVLTTLFLATQDGFRKEFPVNKAALHSRGHNVYFRLEPGYQLVLDGEEDGQAVHLVIDVLDKTLVVDGVTTRIICERETHGGKLIEVSMNYFAIDPATKDVYYFGEDVDMYRNGKVTSHEGSWRAGVNGASFGLAMPGKPTVRDRYYQEVAPGAAMDRAENKTLSLRLATPSGNYERCLRVEETTPLEPGAKEYKIYAPGIGLVADGPLRLTRFKQK